MAVFETGEFVFADGRNWSYVVDSIVDKTEQKTVDRTAISSRVVQMMRIPFTMETLEVEARYHPNEPAVASVFREGQAIRRLDWCVAGPGAGGKVDTFKDLILSEGLKKTNTLTDLVKQSVPLHINGVRESENRFLGYYELRNLNGIVGGTTYDLHDGSVARAKVQNFRQGAPREELDWGADVGDDDALEAAFHIPALTVNRDKTDLTRTRVGAAPGDGEFRIERDANDDRAGDILIGVADDAGVDEDTELDTVVADSHIRLQDASGNVVVLALEAAPAAPVASVETFAYRVFAGSLDELDDAGDFTVSIQNQKVATAVRINIVQRAAAADAWAAIPAIAGANAVPAGLAPGAAGSLHTLRPDDAPILITINRQGNDDLERYMAVEVVVEGADSEVSFDVGIILKRG